MSKKLIIIIMILLSFVSIFIYALYRSNNFDINEVDIIVENGVCPETVEANLENLKGDNLLFINKKTIINNALNNSLVKSIHIERDFPKKLRIYLKKTQVNGIIIYYEDGVKAYSLINEKLMPINEKDIDSISDTLLIIDSDKESISYLLESDNLDLFVEPFSVIMNNSYLISKVIYSNNGMMMNQYFDVYLKHMDIVLRFRDFFNDEVFKRALEIAKDMYENNENDNNKILDIYHGAFVERH